jgi:UDP-N-acetyl-D-galactosamine dehydrogenase
MTRESEERIAVIGLGYVGLPVAVALARHFPLVGFDIDGQRIEDARGGIDRTGQTEDGALCSTTAKFVCEASGMAGSSVFIITVPTPVDEDHRPDLSFVLRACDTIAPLLKPGCMVVLESTVYPGVTEDICGPRLAAGSGLRSGVDFKLAYSPERINPGDPVHRLEKVVKVVAGQDAETLERVASIYGRVVEAGVHRAPSIKVAEAAKAIENTQRDLNIALMNEIAIICEYLDIPTRDVLTAARTKWNFLPFSPGLVGGHCIGVDPYYLTARAEAAGYHPEVILAGRRINDGMGAFVARRLVKMLLRRHGSTKDSRVAVLGLTFKENVPDLRNSRVPDIVKELAEFGISAMVHDPLVAPEVVERQLGLKPVDWDELRDLDALVLAVPHDQYRAKGTAGLIASLREQGMLIDVKCAVEREELPPTIDYWSL